MIVTTLLLAAAIPVADCVENTRIISTTADRYCGWPTVAETRPGELSLVFSDDRDNHVCPWGKVLLKRSLDGGETWSASEIAANGLLDDRDAGITRLANGDLVLVWFTSTAFHDYIEKGYHRRYGHISDVPDYRQHWSKLDKKAIKGELGSFSMRSTDGGRTWGEKARIPASAPHGCIQLRDGRLLLVGGCYVAESTDAARTWHILAQLPLPLAKDVGWDEPYAVEGEDGVIRCYARSSKFLAYSESRDGGKTWAPRRLTAIASAQNPPFLSRLRDGRILLTYGTREWGRVGILSRIGDRDGTPESFERAEPIRLYASRDNDLGYASTVERPDGKLLTVFYAHEPSVGLQASLLAVTWTLPERKTPADAFAKARPVWPAGCGEALNEFFAFRADYVAAACDNPVLKVTSAYDYKVSVNGRFLGFGPIRAERGTFRIDRWPLPPGPATNRVEIQVAGYNCMSYYFMKEPPQVIAEITADNRILAATGKDGAFTAWTAGRVQKAPRFGEQRTFSDVWRVGEDAKGPLSLAERTPGKYLPRALPYPDFALNRSFEPTRKEKLTFRADRKIATAHFIDGDSETRYDGYPIGELASNPYYDLQRHGGRKTDGSFEKLVANEAVTFVGDRNAAGFLGLHVTAEGPCRILMAFDELTTSDGDVDFTRLGCASVAEWRIVRAGEFDLETFEPYAAKAIKVALLEGKATISAPWIRTYASPLADRAMFRSSDPALTKIFAAGRESYRANAVDGFTDCPLRERAYWAGDTFFTGRASAMLTGDASIERVFLGNFLTGGAIDWSGYDSKGVKMDGAIPALYPGDVIWSNFIPNFMMWLTLQTHDYAKRFDDAAFLQLAKPKILGIIEFLRRFRNADGLLEKLPGWVFVDWSKANGLVQDVNYPSSMMYAAILEAVDRIYGLPDYGEEAVRVRKEILRQSWDGTWFHDRALRQADGTLKVTEERTEACQNFAFFFGTATPKSHPELWRRLIDEFGPTRVERKVYPEIAPCNFLFGTCIRLELLSRIGRSRQILEEARGWFLPMAERTGTLWEHLSPTASCCHGFSSIAACYLMRDILGVREIDRRRRRVRIEVAKDLPLDWCEGVVPLSPTEIAKVSWSKTNGTLVVSTELPESWMLADEAERRDAALARPRGFVYNTDGDDMLYWPNDMPVSIENFNRRRLAYATNSPITTVSYCPLSSGFGHFTCRKAGTPLLETVTTAHHGAPNTYNAASKFFDLGTDALQMASDFCRSNNLEIFVSIRVNDQHDASSSPKRGWNALYPEFKRNHADCLVGAYGSDNAKLFPMCRENWSCVNFACEPVREEMRRFVREFLENYDVDGIEFDFNRHGVLFKSVAEGGVASDAERNVMTDLMRDIRTIAREVGRRKGRYYIIAMRAPDSAAFNRDIGIDLARWFAEGLVDIWIGSGYFRLTPWEESVALAHKYGIRFYASVDESRIEEECRKKGLGFIPGRETLPAYAAVMANARAAGADGSYVFNREGDFLREIAHLDVSPGAATDKIYFVRYRGAGGYRPDHWLLNGSRHDKLPKIDPGKADEPGSPVYRGGDRVSFSLTIADDFKIGKPVRITAKALTNLKADQRPVLVVADRRQAADSVDGGLARFSLAADALKCGANAIEFVFPATGEGFKLFDFALEVDY